METRNPSRAPLAERLMDAGEELYGRFGIAAVSLRQICAEAGSRNTYAVQYHFDDEAGLLRAIHARAIAANEQHRALLLSRLDDRDRRSVRALLDVLHRPVIEYRNRAGDRSYARFLLALHSSASGLEHTATLFENMPIARHVMMLLRDTLSELEPQTMQERFRLTTLMILMSLFNRRSTDSGSEADESAISNALDMAAAAMTA